MLGPWRLFRKRFVHIHKCWLQHSIVLMGSPKHLQSIVFIDDIFIHLIQYFLCCMIQESCNSKSTKAMTLVQEASEDGVYTPPNLWLNFTEKWGTNHDQPSKFIRFIDLGDLVGYLIFNLPLKILTNWSCHVLAVSDHRCSSHPTGGSLPEVWNSFCHRNGCDNLWFVGFHTKLGSSQVPINMRANSQSQGWIVLKDSKSSYFFAAINEYRWFDTFDLVPKYYVSINL